MEIILIAILSGVLAFSIAKFISSVKAQKDDGKRFSDDPNKKDDGGSRDERENT